MSNLAIFPPSGTVTVVNHTVLLFLLFTVTGPIVSKSTWFISYSVIPLVLLFSAKTGSITPSFSPIISENPALPLESKSIYDG
jgi:hypothetical protein